MTSVQDGARLVSAACACRPVSAAHLNRVCVARCRTREADTRTEHDARSKHAKRTRETGKRSGHAKRTREADTRSEHDARSERAKRKRKADMRTEANTRNVRGHTRVCLVQSISRRTNSRTVHRFCEEGRADEERPQVK
eukprot:IDg17263t1